MSICQVDVTEPTHESIELVVEWQIKTKILHVSHFFALSELKTATIPQPIHFLSMCYKKRVINLQRKNHLFGIASYIFSCIVKVNHVKAEQQTVLERFVL